MTFDQLKPNKMLRGPLFAEPVEVIVTVPMGVAVTAKRLRQDYWLYIVFQCVTEPSLNILRDPSTLDWQSIVKVEHYRLRQDSLKHPIELKEESPLYRTGGAE